MKYTIKIWLFTSLLSPIIILLASVFIVHSVKLNAILDTWMIIGFMMGLGTLFSMPAMAIFYLIQCKLMGKLSLFGVKLILSIYAFTSVWISFYLFDHEFVQPHFNQFFWVVIYAITITVAVWVFNLQETPTDNALK